MPDHIRHLTSQQVIDLEHDIIGRLAVRAGIDHQYASVEDVAAALERLSIGTAVTVSGCCWGRGRSPRSGRSPAPAPWC